MSDWECPNCKNVHNASEYPDHWQNYSNCFTFECECGADFLVEVDFDLSFWVNKCSLKMREGV